MILKDYGPDIKYIPEEKQIVAVDLAQLPKKVNQQTTHDSAYTIENCVRILQHQINSGWHVFASN